MYGRKLCPFGTTPEFTLFCSASMNYLRPGGGEARIYFSRQICPSTLRERLMAAPCAGKFRKEIA